MLLLVHLLRFLTLLLSCVTWVADIIVADFHEPNESPNDTATHISSHNCSTNILADRGSFTFSFTFTDHPDNQVLRCLQYWNLHRQRCLHSVLDVGGRFLSGLQRMLWKFVEYGCLSCCHATWSLLHPSSNTAAIKVSYVKAEYEWAHASSCGGERVPCCFVASIW